MTHPLAIDLLEYVETIHARGPSAADETTTTHLLGCACCRRMVWRLAETVAADEPGFDELMSAIVHRWRAP